MGVLGKETDLLASSDRDRLLGAMAESCAERGYAQTTVEDVARRAAVSPRAFAENFTSKEECAAAALNKLVSEGVARISIAAERGADLGARRRAEAAALLELLAGSPAFAWLALIEARHGPDRRLHESYRSARHVLELMVGRAGDAPSPRAAQAALGGAEALVRRELCAGRAAALPSLIENFVYAALVGFLGQREALRQAKLAAGTVGEER